MKNLPNDSVTSTNRVLARRQVMLEPFRCHRAIRANVLPNDAGTALQEQSIVLTGSLSVLSDSEQYIIVDRQKLLGAIGNDFRVNDSFILLGWIYFHGWASL